MQTLTFLLVPNHLRRALLAVLCLVGTGLVPGPARAGAIYYSTTGQFDASQRCPLGICTSDVQQGRRAADADLNNYAILSVGTVAAARLRLDLSGTGQADYRAGVVVANGAGLVNLQVLGAVVLRTYLKTGNTSQLQETRLVGAQAANDALLNSQQPTQLEFVASKPFNQVEIEIGGVNLLYYSARIYYAYAVPVNAQTNVKGYLSRFGGTAGQYSTAGTGANGLVCANTDVANPQNAVDADLSNYAQFSSLATVACPSALRVNLEGQAPAGYYAGFVVGGAGLLDASILSGLRIRTSLHGVPQETATGLAALQLTLLPNGQTQVSFRSTLPFDAVTIERVGLVSALDNLELYYGFGLEPRAFQGSTSVLSNFANPANHYSTSADAVLCVGCAVLNPENAANGPTDASSYATMNVPVGVLSELSLKMELPATTAGVPPGHAGNRAGVVISPGSGLLDLAALEQLTVSTFDDLGRLLESRSGASLLSVSVLPDGRQEVYFNTTRDFSSVQLSIKAGVSALANTKVYYAFADDRPSSFPALITPPAPLPVELTSFAAHWANGAAVLSWATASERNSRYFVVERLAAPEDAFRAVGRVAAAGSSTARHSYSLPDAEAARQVSAVLYYRLRQVDADGKESVSAVVTLTVVKSGTSFVAYPNPAAQSQVVTLQFGSSAPGRQLRVYSQLGQLLRQLPAAAPVLELPVGGLPAGLYHLNLSDASSQPIRLLVSE